MIFLLIVIIQVVVIVVHVQPVGNPSQKTDRVEVPLATVRAERCGDLRDSRRGIIGAHYIARPSIQAELEFFRATGRIDIAKK